MGKEMLFVRRVEYDAYSIDTMKNTYTKSALLNEQLCVLQFLQWK